MSDKRLNVVSIILAAVLLLTCSVAYLTNPVEWFLLKHETTQGEVVDYTIAELGHWKHSRTHYCLTINTQDGDLNYNIQYSVSKMDYDNIKVGDIVAVKDSWNPIDYEVIE